MTSAPATRISHEAGGFTLVELLVALVVIAIGVIALSGVQTRSSRDVYSTGLQTRAIALAENHLETTRSVGYSAAASTSGQDGVFQWATQVDSVAFELKRVGVTVTWNEQARTQTIQLQTLLSAR